MFNPERLSLIVQPVGDGGIRFFSYPTDDTEATLTAAGYATNAADYGLRAYDLIFVTPIAGAEDTYILAVDSIDADGHATLASPGPIGDMLKSIYDPTNVAGDAFDSGNHAFLPTGTGATERTVRDKLREIQSVLDFGAVGDCTAVSTGTLDDAAIQLAFDWVVAAPYRKLVFPAGYRYRVGSTCTANFAGRYGGQIAMEGPITPDPGIGNAFELVNANMVNFQLLVLDGGQTADYSQRDPSGADQAFVVRGVRGGKVAWQGHNYKGRVMRLTKEQSGEPKTSRLSIPYAKTGDFGAAACGQNIYADAGSALGIFSELHCFWDVYGPVFENVADVNIVAMDAGWNAGNNGMEMRGVISFWAHLLSAGDETQATDLFTFKPSVSDTVTHNATNYTAIADSVGIEPGVTSGWASYWSASGAGGDAWSADKHYILGRNCANIDVGLFAYKGKKGVVLNNVGSDGNNCSMRLRVKSRENGEHGVHMTTCRGIDLFLDSVQDEIPLETVGVVSGDMHLKILDAEKQAIIVGADGRELNFSGKVQNANVSATATTSVVDVNSTGRDINFQKFNIETADADYAFDLVSGNYVALLDCDLTLSGATVAMGTNAPRVARNVGGYRTENEGIATILSGNTSVVVNHGLVFNPSAINLTGRNSTEVSAPWESGVGATTFQINVAAAVSADRQVYWRASRYQSQA